MGTGSHRSPIHRLEPRVTGGPSSELKVLKTVPSIMAAPARTALWVGAISAACFGTLEAQDTLWVSADNAPVWGSDVELVEELRIGRLDGEEFETFGGIGGVVVVGDVIHVTDWQIPAIRRFSLDGSYLGDLGGRGEGPGELLRVNGIAVLGGERVVVQDVRRGRAIVFGSDGEHLFEFPLFTGLNSVFPTLYADVHGNTYVKAVDWSDPADGLDNRPTLWIRHNEAGHVTDTVWVGRRDPVGPAYTLTGASGPRFPLTVDNQAVVSPLGYVVWGRTDRYAFFRELPDGRIVGVSRAADPLNPSAEEKRQWREFSEHFERSGNSDPYPAVPDVKPFFRRLCADEMGRIWVERYVEPYEYEYSAEERAQRGNRPLYTWREPQVFDVFEPAGRFLGTVRLPVQTRLAFASEDRLWAIERGSFGEEYLVQYAIGGRDFP